MRGGHGTHPKVCGGKLAFGAGSTGIPREVRRAGRPVRDRQAAARRDHRRKAGALRQPREHIAGFGRPQKKRLPAHGIRRGTVVYDGRFGDGSLRGAGHYNLQEWNRNRCGCKGKITDTSLRGCR